LAARILSDLGVDLSGVAELLAFGVHSSPMIDLALARCGRWTRTSLDALDATAKARRWLGADGIPELLDDLGVLGYVRGVARGKSACTLVGALLKQMGLTTVSGKVWRDDGKWENSHWVAAEALRLACSRARRCFKRLLGEEVPEPAVLDGTGGEPAEDLAPDNDLLIKFTCVDDDPTRWQVTAEPVPG